MQDVRIIGTDGDWTQIESGKVKGYVKSEYLMTGEAAIAKAQEVKQTVATVTTTTLYVRDEANTDSHVITMMPEGEELEVLEVLDGWVRSMSTVMRDMSLQTMSALQPNFRRHRL